MLQAVQAGGGDGKKLARHGISGLLSMAAGVNYGYTFGFTQLHTDIRNAYLAGVFSNRWRRSLRTTTTRTTRAAAKARRG